MSLKPVCVPCRRFFRMRKAGYYFTEGMPVGSNRPEPGLANPSAWKPYKVWSGDLWVCGGCGAQVISGFGASPVAVHHEARFQHAIEQTRADQLMVCDC